MRYLFSILFALLCISQAHATTVLIETELGTITIKLYDKKAPVTVKNFLTYVDEGFYTGTLFHRVIPQTMIQSDASNTYKPTHPPIRNEAKNGLKNLRGTIAMSRTMGINTATTDFFLNLKDNNQYNHAGPLSEDYGYAVFGKVIQGMDVVDAIANGATCGSTFPDSWVFKKPVTIISITRQISP